MDCKLGHVTWVCKCNQRVLLSYPRKISSNVFVVFLGM